MSGWGLRYQARCLGLVALLLVAHTVLFCQHNPASPQLDPGPGWSDAGPGWSDTTTASQLRQAWNAACRCDSLQAPTLRWQACLAEKPLPRLIQGFDRPLRRAGSGKASNSRFRREFTCFGLGDTLHFLELYRRNRYWKVYRYRVLNGKTKPDGPQWSFDARGRVTEVLHCETGEQSCRRWQALAYWPNDSLARAGWFWNGQPDSLHLSWYDHSGLRSRLHYRQGRLLHLDGLWTADGQPLDPGGFSQGEGDLLIYSLNGIALERRTYRDGRVVRRKKIRP
jgi:hypothetical protein